MMRSFIVALASILVVSGYGSFEALRAQAQQAAQPLSLPLVLTGGTPGMVVEIFLNAGKNGETTINSTGGADWVLTAGNMGKTTIQIYVDVCKDGKIVKVLFVTGGGQPPPKDKDCDRRLVAAGFQSDCRVTRITIDIRTLGANVVGCGNLLTRPVVWVPILSVIAVLSGVSAGDDGPATSQSSGTTGGTTPATGGTATTDYTVTAVAGWDHPLGTNQSFECKVISTTPAQPNAAYTVVTTGPGVFSNQPTSGTLDGAGRASIRIRITLPGSYTNVITVTSNGVQRQATVVVSVTGAPNTCPIL